jgi:hypothetical protein
MAGYPIGYTDARFPIPAEDEERPADMTFTEDEVYEPEALGPRRTIQPDRLEDQPPDSLWAQSATLPIREARNMRYLARLQTPRSEWPWIDEHIPRHAGRRAPEGARAPSGVANLPPSQKAMNGPPEDLRAAIEARAARQAPPSAPVGPPLGAMPYPRRAAARDRLASAPETEPSPAPSPDVVIGQPMQSRRAAARDRLVPEAPAQPTPGAAVGDAIRLESPATTPVPMQPSGGATSGPEAVADAVRGTVQKGALAPERATSVTPRAGQNVVGSEEQRLRAALESAQGDAQDERTRQSRLGIAGLVAGMLGAPGLGMGLAAGSRLVRSDGRRAEAEARSDIAAALERREAERVARRQELADMLSVREAERLEADTAADEAFRRSQLSQDETQFQQSENQDMKIAERRNEAADRRSRRHSNAMVGRDPDAGVGSGPRPNPDGTPETPEQAAARVSADLNRYRVLDREFVDYTAAVLEESGINIDTPEGRAQLRDYVAPYANLLGQVSGRRGRERNAALARMGSAEGRRGRMGDADRNQFQRQLDSLADDVETHRNAAAQASSAAAALRRLVSAAGSQGAAILRDGGDLATVLARVEGPEVEAARAQFANYLGSLLHERGGTAVTPTEEQRILASIAAGNMAISPEATIRMLQGIATRASERERFYIRNADQAVRDEFLRRQGGGAAAPPSGGAPRTYSIGDTYTAPDGRTVTLRSQRAVDLANGSRQ